MLKVGDWVQISCTCKDEDCRKHREAKTLFLVQTVHKTNKSCTLANQDGTTALRGRGYAFGDLIPAAFLAAARNAIQAAGVPAAPGVDLAPEADAGSK